MFPFSHAWLEATRRRRYARLGGMAGGLRPTVLRGSGSLISVCCAKFCRRKGVTCYVLLLGGGFSLQATSFEDAAFNGRSLRRTTPYL